MQVGQQLVDLAQPLLLMLPLGIVVRQNTALLVSVLDAMAAPVRLASTRHAPLRLAWVKFAPRALAPRKLAAERLHLLQLTPFRVLEAPKSHFARFAFGPGLHGEPL